MKSRAQVLLADGKPLSGGWIYFVPKGDLPVTPSGVIGADGTFSLVTGGSGDGRTAGRIQGPVEAPPVFNRRSEDPEEAALSQQVQRRRQLGPGDHGASRANQLEPIRLK